MKNLICQGAARRTPHASCCSRFPVTLLLCGLIICSLARVSCAADLTVSGSHPKVHFDDTNIYPGSPERAIWGSSSSGFVIEDDQTSTDPFRIDVGAPTSSVWP